MSMSTRTYMMLVVAALVLGGCASRVGGATPSPGGPLPEQTPALLTDLVITLGAERTTVQPGECATLEWNVEGQGLAHLNGQPVERAGQTQVCPTETTTYRLEVDTGKTLERREIVIVVSGAAQPTEPLPVTSAPPQVTGVNVQRDIEYGRYTLNGQEYSLFLDLYLPEQSTTGQPPLIIFIHGGAWISGSKGDCPGRTFAQNGYAVACVDYRLAPMSGGGCTADLIFPAPIHDVKAAVRWLRGRAGEYGFDVNRFAAMGNSSGGHLASLLGTSFGVTELAGTGNLGMSDAVQAVVDWFGPVDARQPPPEILFEDDPCLAGWESLNTKYGGEETPFFLWTFGWGSFLGGSLTDTTVLEQARRATPLIYVDASDPPFLIMHGENDGMVPIEQSELLVSALQSAGVEVTFVRLPGIGHGFGGPEGSGTVLPEFLQPTLAFFDSHLK